MQRTPSGRPARPTRSIPDIPPVPTDSQSPVSEPSESNDAQTFHTPPVSPLTEQSSLPSASPKQTLNEELPRDDQKLTPLRAHYLKKQLIALQFQYEFHALVSAPTNNISTFSYLGAPFTPLPKDAPRLDLPLTRYFFRKFFLSFPFLTTAPRNFFPDKVQPFLDSLLSRNLSVASVFDDDTGNSEEAARLKVLAKLERNASMLITSATKLIEPEETVRLSQADLDRLERIAKKRAARERRLKDSFDVNIVCVRSVTEKGRVRSRVHEEFILRTRRSHHQDVFVSRRYGDFKTLAAELRKAHPSEDIPSPPPKDRTVVSVTVSAAPSPIPNFSATSPNLNQPGSPISPTSSQGNRFPGGIYDQGRNSSSTSFDSYRTMSPTSPLNGGTPRTGGSMQASRLAREKNRLTLRSYVHTLMSNSELASSPVLRSFLLSNPTRLSEHEIEDARKREEADRVREDGRKRFAKEIAGRVDGLREAVRSVKGEIVGKDGLTHIFSIVKQTPDIRDLPPNYQSVVEWARISLASTVFQQFVASDTASETLAGLKRINGLMPWFLLKTVLKISNPVAMIRGVLDLFLAQPFGGRSLLQRMFTGSLMEEVRALEEDIEAVKDKVDDSVMCEKLRLFVYAPPEIQAVYKADAASEDLHIVVAVLRSGEAPALSRSQMQRVAIAHRAHQEYMRYTETLDDSDDDEGPQEEAAWLIEDLSVLAKLYSRLRDREQMIELIFEGNTADLLKDIITIFYAPLAQVYRAASIADSIGDMQNFINDLIRTVEQSEELSQVDPSRTVQIFIDLIQRHEQSFYSFVHKVHTKGATLFDSLMQWIEIFLTLIRDGLGDGRKLSLEFLLPHTGQEREDIIKEIDAVALYHYKLKVAYQDKVRRRFGRTQGLDDADAADETTSALLNGVMQEVDFGDLVQGDADDLAAQETDDDDDSSDEWSGSESDSDSDDDDSDEDSGEDEDSEESDETSSEGASTERDSTPHKSPASLPNAPGPSRSPNPVRFPDSHSRHGTSHSLNISSNQPTVRPARSMTFSHPPPSRPPPPLPSREKALPVSPLEKPLPVSPAEAQGRRSTSRSRRSRERRGQSSPNKRKGSSVLKPPELHHIPKLLPLFVEMMRPLLRTEVPGS